jgi:hypothetical protein
MLQRGLTVEALAADCGVKPVTISNQVAKNFPSRHLRAVVEQKLQACIWSPPEEFAARGQFVSRNGFDPFVLSVPDLQKAARKLKLKGRSRSKRRTDIIALLFQHSAAAPINHNPPTV